MLRRSIISFMEDPRSGHGKSLEVFSIHVRHQWGRAGRTGRAGTLPGMPVDLGRLLGSCSSLGMNSRGELRHMAEKGTLLQGLGAILLLRPRQSLATDGRLAHSRAAQIPG